MEDPVIGSKKCPGCQASAVVRGQKSKFASPSFQCGACGAEPPGQQAAMNRRR